ncbi:MAG: hypothetical protein WCE44_02740 [Candidatus Velthaea sp.]
MNTTWILGAPDPEMQAIEAVLRAHGQRVEYAFDTNGKRVHPGSAYRTTASSGGALRPDGGDVASGIVEATVLGVVFLVECAPAAHIYGDVAVEVVDHHREGDPGYGCPPAEFLSASSIGQVLLHLARIEYGVEHRFLIDLTGHWALQGVGSYEQSAVEPEHVLVAAADHCLAAAYRRECPGVDPDELMRWRISSRARFQGRDEAALLADVEATRGRLWDLRDDQSEEYSCGASCCGYQPPAVIVVPNYEHLPELPEAAAREGLAVEAAGLVDRDGRRKVVLTGCCPPDVVARWMDGQRALGREVYGDPARGFAGAYIA